MSRHSARHVGFDGGGWRVRRDHGRRCPAFLEVQGWVGAWGCRECGLTDTSCSEVLSCGASQPTCADNGYGRSRQIDLAWWRKLVFISASRYPYYPADQSHLGSFVDHIVCSLRVGEGSFVWPRYCSPFSWWSKTSRTQTQTGPKC